MTHIPTGIVVACQNERFQIKNRAVALKLLKARVRQHYKDIDEKERQSKLAEKKKIEWGSQIRSYVLHPYNMVKDHRTDVKDPPIHRQCLTVISKCLSKHFFLHINNNYSGIRIEKFKLYNYRVQQVCNLLHRTNRACNQYRSPQDMCLQR